MKGRDSQPSDFLVCFPSRAHHLTLMQKPICSPARPNSEHNKKHNHHQQFKKSSTRNGVLAQNSPALWPKNKEINSEISEPTSPKVTCAGQIKIRQKKTTPCKSWQSVMEEIERIHNTRNHKKKRQQSWAESFGFKKEAMQFLACLRNLKLDFRCFGGFPTSDNMTTEDDDDEYHETQLGDTGRSNEEGSSSSGTVFSKWYMVLRENHNSEFVKDGLKEHKKWCSEDKSVSQPCVPPPNALLLMRCRSAPAKELLKERDEIHEEKKERHGDCTQGKQERGSFRQLRLLMEVDRKEEEIKKKKENMMVTKTDNKPSTENYLSRSQSCKK